MALGLRIGKETQQGYGRVISQVDSVDLYSYSMSALIALEYLRRNRSTVSGRIMGYPISALRQLLFAKVRRDNKKCERLPLGTLYWGDRSEMPDELLTDDCLLESLGELDRLIRIWPTHVSMTD